MASNGHAKGYEAAKAAHEGGASLNAIEDHGTVLDGMADTAVKRAFVVGMYTYVNVMRERRAR